MRQNFVTIIQFKDLQIGDRVKTHHSGWATVVKIGCYDGSMVKLKCDNPKWSCPYFYESEIDLNQTIPLTPPI